MPSGGRLGSYRGIVRGEGRNAEDGHTDKDNGH